MSDPKETNNKDAFPGMALWLSGGNANMSDPKETTKPYSARESAKRMGITPQRDDTHLDIETGKRMTDDMDETTQPSVEAMEAAAKAIEITRDNYATLQVRVAWALDAFAAQAVAEYKESVRAIVIAERRGLDRERKNRVTHLSPAGHKTLCGETVLRSNGVFVSLNPTCKKCIKIDKAIDAVVSKP